MLMSENQTSLAPTKPAYALNQPHPARLKYLTGFMAAVALGFGSLQAASEDNQVLRELIEILRAKGSITTEEYDALKKASAPEPATSTETNAAPEVPATPPAEPTPDTEKPKRRDILADQTSSPITPLPKEAKWYDKIGFGGYTQVRYATVWNQEGEDLNVPADKSASNDQSFFLRRGRIKFSGDVHPHLYLYSQMDFAGSTASGGSFAIGMKDLYGDISLDADKAYRFRVGHSKVPFGWVNMQSSQNRAPLERPDGINSAAEGERDLGVYFMYAPPEVRSHLKELVKSGLKGSGDYGMFTVGAYAGQGPNRTDLNGEPHLLARLTYPFKLANGQFVEVGAQAYTGNFVVTTAPINGVTPSQDNRGVTDQRVGLSAAWYPQPFGIEAEWNIGRGPRLTDDYTSLESDFLHGGYVQLNYQVEPKLGRFFPFARWNYYEGGRKFGANAPFERVNELDFGFEYSPWKPVELTVAYTHTINRTNTKGAPYDDTTNADRLSFQAQINY